MPIINSNPNHLNINFPNLIRNKNFMEETKNTHPLVAAISTISAWRKLNSSYALNDAPEEIKKSFSIAVEQLAIIKPGDFDPWLGKKVCTIIRKSTTRIIYIDEDYRIQWWWIAQEGKNNVGYVQSQISRLEHESQFLLAINSNRLLNIRILLGEAIAISLENGTQDESLRVLNFAENSIKLAKDEYCKPIYLKSYLAFWFLSFALFLITNKIIHSELIEFHPKYQMIFFIRWFESMICGVTGAILFSFFRGNHILLDPQSGKMGIILNAVTRSIVGGISGVIVSFAFDAGLLFNGLLTDSTETSFRLFLCIIAGASERFLPNLLEKTNTLLQIPSRDKD